METTLAQTIFKARKRGDKTAALFKKNGQWQERSWLELDAHISQTAAGLNSLGLQRGERVALISETRYEWSFVDFAILAVGGVTVPIYPSSLEEDIEFMLNNSEAKILVLENEIQAKKWQSIISRCPHVEHIVFIDAAETKTENSLLLSELMKKGQEKLSQTPNLVDDEISKSQMDDTITILYTSGTTGQPKGVVITNVQAMSELEDVFRILDLHENDRNLAFLPLSHILGRVEMWGHVYVGFSAAYAESIEKIRANLGEVSPTFLIAVPRIFEKIYNGVLSNAEVSPVKNKIFRWAVSVGKKVSEAQLARKPVPLATAAQYKLATKLVFEKLHKGLGGRLRWALSGSAPLSQEISQFFHAAGILVLEGYGLTETTAGIAANSPTDFAFGNVGKPIGEAEIKIAEDGEILARGKKIMKEYYKNPEATAESIKDGWFHTGDIGEFTPEGRLKITDRKKDLIKTAGGKYVAPQKLEGILKLNKYIANVLIHGDQKKYIVALVTLDPDAIRSFAEEEQISYSATEELSKNEKVEKLIRQAVTETNSNLASYESIKNFAILGKDFTIESGELTPSLKVKRKVCDEKYKSVIDGLYGVDRSSI